jgi:hypothetical protein
MLPILCTRCWSFHVPHASPLRPACCQQLLHVVSSSCMLSAAPACCVASSVMLHLHVMLPVVPCCTCTSCHPPDLCLLFEKSVQSAPSAAWMTRDGVGPTLGNNCATSASSGYGVWRATSDAHAVRAMADSTSRYVLWTPSKWAKVLSSAGGWAVGQMTGSKL